MCGSGFSSSASIQLNRADEVQGLIPLSSVREAFAAGVGTHLLWTHPRLLRPPRPGRDSRRARPGPASGRSMGRSVCSAPLLGGSTRHRRRSATRVHWRDGVVAATSRIALGRRCGESPHGIDLRRRLLLTTARGRRCHFTQSINWPSSEIGHLYLSLRYNFFASSRRALRTPHRARHDVIAPYGSSADGRRQDVAAVARCVALFLAKARGCDVPFLLEC